MKKNCHVRISENKNIFAKGYAPNWSEEIFVVKKKKKYCTIKYCTLDLCNQ